MAPFLLGCVVVLALVFCRLDQEPAVLPPGEKDRSPYPEGMSRILRGLGRPDADYEDVMARSGAAFVTAVDLEGPRIEGELDVAWWPNDAWPFALRAKFLGDVYGREIFCLRAPMPSSDGPMAEDLQRLVAASLAAGRPCLGESDAAMIITGLKEGRPVSEWASPGQPVFGWEKPHTPWGVFALGESKPPLSLAQADLETLQWAVALGRDKAVQAKGKFTGRKAWEEWQKLLEKPTSRAWDVNMVVHLKYQREAAEAWLSRLAQRSPAPASTLLLSASSEYREVLQILRSVPFWSPEAPPSAKEAYRAGLRQAARHEAKAMDLMEQAAEALAGEERLDK